MTERPFHIALLRPEGYPHASALTEAVEYLAHALTACGHRARIAENVLDSAAHNIIACAHLMAPAAVDQLPRDVIVLNGEPLSHADDWQFTAGTYHRALERAYIWDYSQSNLARLPHARVSVIPFWYRRELVRAQLPRVPGESLLFYGVLTPHRRRVLAELAAHSVTVDVMYGVYGEPRDRAMRASLAVLNVKKRDEDDGPFEAIRCFHPLINEVPVISEDTTDPTADPFRNSVVFVPRAGFSTAVAAQLADRRAFLARQVEAVRAFAALDPLPAIAAAVESYLRSRA